MGPRVYRFRGVGGCTHRTGRAARPFRRVVCIFVMNGSLFLYVKTVCAFRPEPESRIHRCGLSVNNPLLTHRISYPTPPPPPRKRDLDNMNMNGQKYKIHSRLQGQGGGLTGLCSSLCFSRLTLAASELLLFCVPLLCLCWACSFTTPPPLHPADCSAHRRAAHLHGGACQARLRPGDRRARQEAGAVYCSPL